LLLYLPTLAAPTQCQALPVFGTCYGPANVVSGAALAKQPSLKLAAGTKHAALRGPDGAAGCTGQFFVAHALHHHHDQRLALAADSISRTIRIPR
jgi:hypothetical protein